MARPNFDEGESLGAIGPSFTLALQPRKEEYTEGHKDHEDEETIGFR
jgi:hypothetical protein